MKFIVKSRTECTIEMDQKGIDNLKLIAELARVKLIDDVSTTIHQELEIKALLEEIFQI